MLVVTGIFASYIIDSTFKTEEMIKMNKRLWITLITGMVALLSVLSLPLYAQEEDLETIPISGSLDYVPELLLLQEVGGTTFFDAGLSNNDIKFAENLLDMPFNCMVAEYKAFGEGFV